jgi:biotin transporter BioY
MDLSWSAVFIAGVLPFLAGDAVKGIVAAAIAPRLRRIIAELL